MEDIEESVDMDTMDMERDLLRLKLKLMLSQDISLEDMVMVDMEVAADMEEQVEHLADILNMDQDLVIHQTLLVLLQHL